MGDKTPYANEAILALPQEPRVLLLRNDGSWTLPGFAATEPPEIILAIRERLGVEMVVMRRVYDRAPGAGGARADLHAGAAHTGLDAAR